MDCVFTAAGIYDCYWEEGLQLYDVAAGAIIAMEAGALLTDHKGGNAYPAEGTLCATPKLHEKMLAMLQRFN